MSVEINAMIDKLLVTNSEDNKDQQENVKKFKDGLAFIKAMTLQKDVKDWQQSTRNTGPVQQKWQIWYWKPNNGREWRWEDFLQMRTSFATKDEFWRSYNEVNGYELGLLGSHFNYCVFKEGIKPMWEDQANCKGGRWVLEFPRKTDWRHMTNLNEIWVKLLLSITGTNWNNEPFNEYFGDISGLVLMVRHNVNKIAIWSTNADNTPINLKIGHEIKISTGFNGKMYYMSHKSNAQKIVINREKRVRFNANQTTKT